MTSSELLTLAQVATPVVLAVGGWLLRNSLARFTDQIAALQQAQQRHAANLDKHTKEDEAEHTALLNQKVDREDWIRETSRSRITMERVVESLARMEGRMDVGTRIAAAVESLAREKGEEDVHP